MLYLSPHFASIEQAQKDLQQSAFLLLDIHQVLFHRRGILPLMRGIVRVKKKPQTFKEGIQALCSLKTWKSLHLLYKKGNRITEAYLDTAKQRTNLHSELINYSNNIYTADQHMELLLHHLKKQGHELYLLSNIGNMTLARLQETYRTYFSLMTDMRNTINRDISDEAALLWKPQAAAYQEALKITNKASAAHLGIFIDDTKRNVEAAHDCGLNAILFRSFAQCKDDLEILLGISLPK